MRVSGFGVRDQSLGFRVWGLGCTAQDDEDGVEEVKVLGEVVCEHKPLQVCRVRLQRPQPLLLESTRQEVPFALKSCPLSTFVSMGRALGTT